MSFRPTWTALGKLPRARLVSSVGRCLLGLLFTGGLSCSDLEPTAARTGRFENDSPQSVASPLAFGLSWPAEQLLPSFPASATNQDLIFLRTQSDDERVLFASLKGIVNKTEPRIFSYEGDASWEGEHTWLESLGLTWTTVANNWDLIVKYRNELSGVVVYDNTQLDTMNLATSLAGEKKALVVSPALVTRLTSAPYNLPVLLDFRGKYRSKLAVYQALYDTYWPTLQHRIAFGLNPLAIKAAVREYATAVGGASLWLDPDVPSEAALLNQFLASMGAGAVWMGWWPNEAPGVTAASKYGIATVASDFAVNLTVQSGMPRTIHVKPMPAKPALENKLYVAFILSDGDNLQFVEHLLRKLWSNPDRGKVPMGWTLSPAMVDAMPGALDYFWNTSTPNDCLISGPSGYGYTYPNLWQNPTQLEQFVAKTESYNERAGFRVVTVWNTITGGINANVGSSFAKNAVSLLGLTAQNTGGGLTVYDDTLPGMALSCNYCTGEQAMKDFIASSARGWTGKEPRFLIIQAQPWQNVTPTSFMNVAASLSGDYRIVRPDHIFQLIRQSKGLPVNPLNRYSIVTSSSGRGAVSPSGPLMLNQNESQTFTFMPDAGYAVRALSVDGVSTSGAPAYTFTNVTENHTLDVTFAAQASSDGAAGSAPSTAGAGGAGGTGAASAGVAGSTASSAAGAGAAAAAQPSPISATPSANEPGACSFRALSRSTNLGSAWAGLGTLLLVSRSRARSRRRRSPSPR